jgi:general secretion pathway protein D
MNMAGREKMAGKALQPYRWFLIYVLVLTIGCMATAHAQTPGGKTPKAETNKTISMDFDQVDIKVFIKFMSELTGKNFVVDDKVRGKVTVLSPTKISVEEAYRVFLSVLEVNGFTTVPADKVIKVVPSVSARQQSVDTLKGFVPRPEDRVITQIIPLIYADSQEMRKLLAPLVSKQGVMVAYDPTDTLIITDYQSNVQRLLHIIEELDVESGEATISVLHLEYAGAEKLANTVTQLVESQQQVAKGRRRVRAESPVKIVPDERINVLIVLADWQDTQMIQGLIKQLDQPTPKDAGNIQVVYLENAQAEELAKVLSGLPGKGAEKGKEPVISAEVKVVADKATNSLVITAKPEEFEVLTPVIEKLDIPRKQVFVEALIMEVTAGMDLQFGVNWLAAGTTKLPEGRSGVVFGSSQPGGVLDVLSEATNTLAIPAAFSAGVVSFPITIGDFTFTNLAAVIQASKTSNDFNIISTPQLMTLDNEEASVVVADNIPFSTRVDQGTAVTDRAISSFEYRDVGTTLKVTPQINEKRFVKLKIYQEVSRVVQETVSSGDQVFLTPTTKKRTSETNVEVKDGQTVVIAGLIGEDTDATTSGTPCLMDIPLLGWLFKTRTERGRYTNLLVFLTPHIVASPVEAERIYQKKTTYMEEVQRQGAGEIDEPVAPSDEPVAPSDEPVAPPDEPVLTPQAPVPQMAPEEG